MKSHFKTIEQKLEAIIKRYYVNVLLKGLILFVAIWLLYVLVTLFVENVFWLGTIGRGILFWTCILVSVGLLGYLIFMPLAKLAKLQKGINYSDAAVIIGNQFPEVNDKLLNVLQLHESAEQSELVLASIDQKSIALEPVPFRKAINLKSNVKYLKYLAIPFIIIGLVWVSGNLHWFSDSYRRVVHYKTAYEPPAPFQFFVLNDDLQTIQNKDFVLKVNTAGSVIPENVQISYNGQQYFLKQILQGSFEYTFVKPNKPIEFVLLGNDVTSKPYRLEVLEAPALLSFGMTLDYPEYTKKEDVILKGSGNATVPEGTIITWDLKTKATQNVTFYSRDTVNFNAVDPDNFSYKYQAKSSFDYVIAASNSRLQDYESLGYGIEVAKDAYPEIAVRSEVDTLGTNMMFFYGQLSDDYGLSQLDLVYYPSNNVDNKKVVPITFNKSTIAEFYNAFPDDTLDIIPGVSYEVYFQVKDNDQVNGPKSARSKTFVFRKATKEELNQKQLDQQQNTIKNIGRSMEGFEKQEKSLEELAKTQKEKRSLNFNDQKKLKQFLERQKQQDELMNQFNQDLQQNLDELQQPENSDQGFKDDLEKRLKDNEEQLKKDEKLLEELEKIKDKISQEELTDRLDELAKRNKNKKRSLQQLLELTKRYYVQNKLEQLKDILGKLAEEQESLSKENSDNSSHKQEELNKQFQDLKESLDQLEKDSQGLRKPIDIPRDRLDENAIQKEQKDALGSLEESERQSDSLGVKPESNPSMQRAKQSQKNASDRMKELQKKMKTSSMSIGQEQLQEDTDMLRQILDNVVLFSFDQEALMNVFKNSPAENNKFASNLLKQNDLRNYFEHVDDSLFALSLRQPKLSETVNKNISDVYYNIDKALDQFSEGDVYQGTSRQQFVVTSANNLADFLSEVLDNMEENLNMSSGESGEGEMQLPDIIMSQEQLNKMMQEGMENSMKGKEQEGDDKDGEKSKEGNKGEQKSGNGSNENGQEEMNGMLYEIYQRQQELRQQLQDKLAKDGLSPGETNVLNKMEEVESDLLNDGFTNETLQKMLDLKHQLLKMDDATFLQGEDNKRESNTNRKDFQNHSNNQIPDLKRYFNSLEILNKQALPLQQNYKKKVQEYFKEKNDSI
ncbi:DUF4175 family protein [Gaetbulibacter aestuarii]|uniref:DUF4175 family protein n=1 Tax=Gaetbulibacter aestuarii TaxID=1502358 RepID=A0ABW7MV89_9FLAO